MTFKSQTALLADHSLNKEAAVSNEYAVCTCVQYYSCNCLTVNTTPSDYCFEAVESMRKYSPVPAKQDQISEKKQMMAKKNLDSIS